MSSAFLLVEFFSEGEQRPPEAPEAMGSVGLQGSVAGISLRWVTRSPGNSHAIESLGDEYVIWGEDIIVGALGQLGLPITFLPPQHSRRSWRLGPAFSDAVFLFLPLASTPLTSCASIIVCLEFKLSENKGSTGLLSGLWPSCCPSSRWTDIGSSVHPCHCGEVTWHLFGDLWQELLVCPILGLVGANTAAQSAPVCTSAKLT